MSSYFVYNATDQWKGEPKLRMVSHSERKVVAQIKRDIKEEKIEYSNGDNLTVSKQVDCFNEDYKEHGLDYANDHLVYADIQIVGDGEVLC